MSRKKYNVIKIQSLGPKWHDRDTVLLHAAFQILVDFVEGEKPFAIINWTSDKEHKRARREIAKLYCWWKRIRPARQEAEFNGEIPGRFGNPNASAKDCAAWKKYCAESYRLENIWEDEDNRMLCRLVRIRKWLWT